MELLQDVADAQNGAPRTVTAWTVCIEYRIFKVRLQSTA